MTYPAPQLADALTELAKECRRAVAGALLARELAAFLLALADALEEIASILRA